MLRLTRTALIALLLPATAIPAAAALAVTPLDPAEWLSTTLARWIAAEYAAEYAADHAAGDLDSSLRALDEGDRLLVVNARYLENRAWLELFCIAMRPSGYDIVDCWYGLLADTALPAELPPVLTRLLGRAPERGPELSELRALHLGNP